MNRVDIEAKLKCFVFHPEEQVRITTELFAALHPRVLVNHGVHAATALSKVLLMLRSGNHSHKCLTATAQLCRDDENEYSLIDDAALIRIVVMGMYFQDKPLSAIIAEAASELGL